MSEAASLLACASRLCEDLPFVGGPYCLGSFGLVLDIVGVILIYTFRFQSGPRLDPTSALLIESSGSAPEELAEARQARRNRVLSLIGLVLLVAGFILQIWSNSLVTAPAGS